MILGLPVRVSVIVKTGLIILLVHVIQELLIHASVRASWLLAVIVIREYCAVVRVILEILVHVSVRFVIVCIGLVHVIAIPAPLPLVIVKAEHMQPLAVVTTELERVIV